MGGRSSVSSRRSEVTRDPGVPHAFDQGPGVLRGWDPGRLLVVRAQHADDLPEVFGGGPGGLPQFADGRRPPGVQPGVEFQGTGPYRDQRQVVAEGVVHVARDAGPFPDTGAVGDGLLLALSRSASRQPVPTSSAYWRR